MQYQGRSPFKDVTRSVVMGAAMVPAAMLASCSHHEPAPKPPTSPEPQPVVQADAGQATSDPAPPPAVVRPRTPEGTSHAMPTRGFAGAVRVRG